MVRFSKLELRPDGKLIETNIREIKQSDMLKCPHCIMMQQHYRSDGSCKCSDPNETVMAEWGYEWNGSVWIAPAEGDD